MNLNGRLLDSRPLAHNNEPVVIGLPPQAQTLDNVITLTVQRDRDLGGCDVRQTTYPIQLLDSTGLDLGDVPGTGFTAIPRELATGFAVYLPEAGNGDVSALLTNAVPILAEFVAPQVVPEFLWNTQPAPGRPFVLVGQSPAVNTLVHIQDGRLVAGSGAPVTDLTAFTAGTVVQCATGPADAKGVAISSLGTVTIPVPTLGNECAHLSTAGGDIVLDPAGAVVSAAPPRTDPPR